MLFTVAIAFNLASGRTPSCQCFGQLDSARIGGATLLRNGLLLALGAFLVWASWGGAGQGVASGPSGLVLVLLFAGVTVAVLLAFGGWIVVHLLAQQSRLLARIEALEARAGAPRSRRPGRAAGLPIGAPAPDFRLDSVGGEVLSLADLRRGGKPVVLIFTDRQCQPCVSLVPEIRGWQRNHATRLAVVPLVQDSPGNSASLGDGMTQILLQRDREVSLAYHATGTPSAVLVRPDGTIGSLLAMGPDAIRQLVAMAGGTPAAGLKIGTAAPQVELADLNGTLVALAGGGSSRLLLFWHPRCGFCTGMLDALKAWEATRRPGSPALLLVSGGTVADNRAMGLRSPIVLDHGFAAGRAYGAGGTPAAILLDAAGRIASELAVGGPAVRALLETQHHAPPSPVPAANGASYAHGS